MFVINIDSPEFRKVASTIRDIIDRIGVGLLIPGISMA